MAADGADVFFEDMTEEELRQWVEANPGRVNDWDSRGATPLLVAVFDHDSVPLVFWLVDEQGADVNAADGDGYTPIHDAKSLDVLSALFECGADPAARTSEGVTPLIVQVMRQKYELVPRLLQDPRVRASVNVQDKYGDTALHRACYDVDDSELSAIIQILLQAGADLTLKNIRGETPLDSLQRNHPTHPTTVALLQQKLDAEKASFLIKARRLVMAPSRSSNAVAPSFVQGRVACGLPLPDVGLAPVTDSEGDDELRTMLAWVVGMNGGGMPRDVFRVVLDLLMPFWDPLRRKGPRNGGAGEQPSG